MKKIICLILSTVLILAALTSLTSCSTAPEYSEIEERFRRLVEDSAEINKIFFGVGLETYDRVYDPRSTTDVYRDKIVNEDGSDEDVLYYFYEVTDKELGRVIAYRSDFTAPYEYVQVVRTKDESREAVYSNDVMSYYAYALTDYVEPEYEFFYMSTDPTDYDYVRFDCKYKSVGEIKEAAELVYSSEYLNSIYDTMFIGALSASGNLSGLDARYIEYADDEGDVYLMKSNEYEPFFTETRKFDFDTARIVKPSNSKYVNIEVETYLESAPEDRITVRVSMILENGEWMLDSATY